MQKHTRLHTPVKADKTSTKAHIILPELSFPQFQQAFHFSFKTLQEAKELAGYLSSFYPNPIQSRIELGINELFLNAIEHGNLGIDFELKTHLKAVNSWENEIYTRSQDPANKEKIVTVCLEANQYYLLLRVKDEGDGFNWRDYDTSSLSSKKMHGRGLIMIQELCFDKVEFSEKGNEVTCLIYL